LVSQPAILVTSLQDLAMAVVLAQVKVTAPDPEQEAVSGRAQAATKAEATPVCQRDQGLAQ